MLGQMRREEFLGKLLKGNATSDAVTWASPPPHEAQSLAFGLILWGEAGEYPQELVLPPGGMPAGLYHARIT